MSTQGTAERVVRAVEQGQRDGSPRAAIVESVAAILEPFAAGKGGRPAGKATTPDGRLIQRARKTLGVSMTGLAERIGVHKSVLSRALKGELPEAHREAVKALVDATKK